MAILRSLTHAVLEKDMQHTEVDGTYAIVSDKEGKNLQIDTYGSLQRKMPGKKSQSIRFGPEAISQLKAILDEYF
jgi:hypothetical protein